MTPDPILALPDVILALPDVILARPEVGLLHRLSECQLDDEYTLMDKVIYGLRIEADLAKLSQVSRCFHALCKSRLTVLHDEHLQRVAEIEHAFGTVQRLDRAVAGRVLQYHYDIHTYERSRGQSSRAERHLERMVSLAINDAFRTGSSLDQHVNC